MLADDDPGYRGVQVPRRFYKVAAWAGRPGTDGSPAALAAAAFVLDQTPQPEDVDLATRRALSEGLVPPLGPFRTFQVPVGDVADLTGLDLGPLVQADRLAQAVDVRGPATGRGVGCVSLQGEADIRL